MLKESDAAQNCIKIHGLIKKYNYQAVLNDLNLTLEDGQCCVLVGANGAGKTTLLRILATLVRPNGGQITLNGLPINATPRYRREIGYIGHQAMFYQDLNAAENLRHYARLYQINDVEAAVMTGIKDVGLTKHAHKPLRTYSRGMQQRLSIARALIHNPSILLLDEPYTGLDQEAASSLDARLRQLHQPGRVILIAAHRPQRLIPIASHVAWLNDGKISQHIHVTQLFKSPTLQAYLQEAP
jgi:heme exporter protein A